MPDTVIPEQVEARATLACYTCGRQCAGLAGLKAHMRLAHGIASNLPRYVRSSVCLACAGQFASRALCLSHVRRTAACREIYLAEETMMEEDEYNPVLPTGAKKNRP
eukprot:2537835-Amphidinium_carterae.1